MLRLSITGVAASVTEEETLTAGRVGLQCGFSFDAVWNGLFKTAVFEGVETVDVALDDSNVCTVPWECMAVEGVQLKCGVYGANGEGTIVIPTVWAKFGKIQPSPAPSGTEPAEPTQNANAYAVETAEEALSIAQSVRDDADNGEFDGADGADGADGFSPIASVSKVGDTATITITDENGTTTATISDGTNGTNGTDGEDGSLIWKTDVSPTVVLDAVQWDISDLTGRVGADPQEGDLVFYSYYYYTISRVVGTTVTAVDPVNIRGPQGEPGGGGSGDYDDLTDKPQINSVTLSGNKSLADLGIEPEAFVVAITQSGSSYSADKTYAQITAAVSANKRVVAVLEGFLFDYIGIEYQQHTFAVNLGVMYRVIQIAENGIVTIDTGAAGTYSKPYSGIPKTDLASGVQASLLPAVTSSDNGKFLGVDNGVWAAVTVPSASGVSF
jgi:hypothetical protein